MDAFDYPWGLSTQIGITREKMAKAAAAAKVAL
jgi:pyruvate decarboxylase